jgi:hypothetical protein
MNTKNILLSFLVLGAVVGGIYLLDKSSSSSLLGENTANVVGSSSVFKLTPSVVSVEVPSSKATFENVVEVSLPGFTSYPWPEWFLTNTASWNTIYYHYGKTQPSGWGPGSIKWTTKLTGYAPGTYTDTITLTSANYGSISLVNTVTVLADGTSTTTTTESTTTSTNNTTTSVATETIINPTSTSPVVSSAVTESVSTKFKINDEIKTTSKLKVRSTPSLGKNILGTQVSGARGFVIDGPVLGSGYWWWKIKFANGMIGWSAEKYLMLYVATTPTPVAPTLTLTSNTSSVVYGGSATLTWNSANTTSCTASGSWSGARALSGSETFSNLAENKTYTLACSGTGGSISKSVSVAVASAPTPVAPTLTLTSNTSSVVYGGSATLTWNSANTTSCAAGGSWSGARALSGSETFSNLIENKTYTLACTGTGGSVTKSVSVAVASAPVPVPVVSLSTNTTSGTVGVVNPQLTWSAINSPTSCTASGDWSGAKSTSGTAVSQGVLNTVKTYTYTLTCLNATGVSSPKSVSVVVSATSTPTAQITVNTNTRYQKISGWEATSQAGQADSLGFPTYQSNLMNLAANDLGINRMRLEIRSGAENSVDYYAQYRAGTITREVYRPTWFSWVNDNSDPNVINPAGFQFTLLDESIDTVVLPMRQRLAARGESLYLNLNYVSFRNSTAQQDPAEYAELILATFQHMQSKYGFVPNAVEVILEPDNNTIWSGWSNSTAIGQAIAVTGARLAAAGFRPDFIAPSVMNMANAVPFLNQIVAVPGALQYLKEVSYHRYTGVSDANLVAIRDRANQYGLRTSMLEHIGSGVEDLYKDLTLANVSAWQQYTLAFPTSDDGAQYYYIYNNTPIMGSRTPGLRQYFKYVRNGAYRVGASSTDSTLRPVAFTNPNGKAVVVIHVDQAKTISLGGLPSGSYEAVFLPTSGAITTSGVTPVGGVVTVPVSTTGILTIRGI